MKQSEYNANNEGFTMAPARVANKTKGNYTAVKCLAVLVIASALPEIVILVSKSLN